MSTVVFVALVILGSIAFLIVAVPVALLIDRYMGWLQDRMGR